jgi:hypothetical protein
MSELVKMVLKAPGVRRMTRLGVGFGPRFCQLKMTGVTTALDKLFWVLARVAVVLARLANTITRVEDS